MSSILQSLPRRGYLGFEVTARPDASDSSIERWIVSAVDPGSPAAVAGLLVGDDVVVLDGQRVESLADLRARSGRRQVGEEARFIVLRGGDELEITSTSEAMPLEPLSHGRVELADVVWQHESAEHRLRAIWTVPNQKPWGAIWLLPSATCVSQEAPLTTGDPSYHLMNQLTSAGLVTFRVDRSGLGDSEGPACSLLDFSAELSMGEAARANFLGDQRAAGLSSFVFGRSLGGMMAPLLAAEQPFDAVVVSGTSSERWREASRASFCQQLEQKGAKGEVLQWEMGRIDRLFHLVFEKKLSPKEAFELEPDLAGIAGGEFQGNQIHQRVAEFYQNLDEADVASAWRRTTVPVLCLQAEYDILTRLPQAKGIVEIVGAQAELQVLSGVDHFMHERSSMDEAVRVPWGGELSRQVTPTLVKFLKKVSTKSVD